MDMKLHILIVSIVIFLSSCAPGNEKASVSRSTGDIALSDLQYEGGILSGRLRNRGPDTLTRVETTFTFTTPCGRKILEKAVVLVPGGDGKSLAPGMEKHFRIRAKLHWRGRREPRILAHVTAIRRARKER